MVTFVRVLKLEMSDGKPAKRVESWVVRLLLPKVSLRFIGACAYAVPRRVESTMNLGCILKTE